jgi:hypothetical protein
MTDTIPQPAVAGEEIQRNTLSIADISGDTRIMWDPNNRDEVKTAKAAFDAAKSRGMLAYTVDPKSAEKGEVVREFDKDLGKIIMTKQLVGG